MKILSEEKFAEFIGVTPRRVRQLRDMEILIEYRPGWYALKKNNLRYINYIRKGQEVGIDYNEEKAKLIKAKRENEEIDLRLKKKELHESEDIKQIMTDMLISFKSRLSAIPSKLSPTLADKTDKTEIFRLMKKEIDEALCELSDFDTAFNYQETKEDSG